MDFFTLFYALAAPYSAGTHLFLMQSFNSHVQKTFVYTNETKATESPYPHVHRCHCFDGELLKSTLKMSLSMKLSSIQRHKNFAGLIYKTEITLREAQLTFPWQPKEIWNLRNMKVKKIPFFEASHSRRRRHRQARRADEL